MIDLSQTDPKHFYDVALYNKDNYNTYFVNLTHSANLGYDDAIMLLFEEYNKNMDKMQEFKDPNLINFYKTTAQNDNYHWSINYLGTMYHSGNGVEYDNAKAASLYDRGINKLNPYSMINKNRQITGKYITSSTFDKFVNINDACPSTLYIIGRFYEDGSYGAKEIMTALGYYEKSAKKGYNLAKIRLAYIFLTKIYPTDKSVIQLHKSVIQLNNPHMMLLLANNYRMKRIINKDHTKVIRLFLKVLKLSYSQNDEKERILQYLYKMCKRGDGDLQDYLSCIDTFMGTDMEYEASKIEDLLIGSKKYKYVKEDIVVNEVFI